MKQIFKVVKSILGKNLTKKIRPLGHGAKSLISALFFNFPAKKLKIIAITGTKGKTTTTILTGRLFNEVGQKTGYVSTAIIFDGEKEIINPFKMSTIDAFVMQKYLHKMLENGCKNVVIELTSQGLEQNRHLGLFGFDAGVFLNIFPEHIEAHGGFENYKKAKSKLFSKIKKTGTFLAHSDVRELEFMASCTKPSVGKKFLTKGKDYKIIEKKDTLNLNLHFKNQEISTQLSSQFDLENLAMAIEIVDIFTLTSLEEIMQKASQIDQHILGRMDLVVKQKKFDIMVDYAHEPESIRQLLETLQGWKNKGLYNNIIHILSCDGAGRDDWKKPIMGDFSYQKSDFIVLTTDNYDKNDNPVEIVNSLSQNFEKEKEDVKYFKQTNRKLAFEKALEIAKKADGKSIIVSTGVGSEYGLTQPEGVIEWNEVQVWKSLV